jgi:cytochrome o ubiquinol oxidase subunit 1
MFGKLNWSAIPLDQPIPMITSGVVGLAILGVLAWVVVRGHLPYVWKEWITSVDHKRIGVMYTLLAMVMLLRGFADAIMMRSQQAMAYQSQGYLPPEHFNQIFSAHGTIMIFFVAMPFMIGLMNLVVPLQLGVRDVAFPTLNSVGFWLTATGALLVNISLVVGEFARTGWLPFPPLSELTYSPGVGVDYYLWSIEISGAGTLVAGINLVTTVLKIRTKGMNYLRMPMVFSRKWSRHSPASRCSATARWCWPPWQYASSRSWSGCTISSRWAPAPTSTRSSASPA